MRRAPKKAYLVMWNKPNGDHGHKWYVRPHAIGPWIQRLARKCCTDVRVLQGDLVDVSADFVPAHYDDAAVEARLRWVGVSELRKTLLTDDPTIVEWLMTHRHAERVIVGVEPLVNRVLTRFGTKKDGRRRTGR
jgi:hypothetical protein